MSWFYRKFTKSDDDATVTLASTNIALTGITTVTGAFTVTGAQTFTGDGAVSGQLKAANLLSTGTIRVSTLPIMLGSGTVGIGWGAGLPAGTGSTGVTRDGGPTTNFGIGSLYINTTYGTLYVKTGHASTAWVTMYATPST